MQSIVAPIDVAPPSHRFVIRRDDAEFTTIVKVLDENVSRGATDIDSRPDRVHISKWLQINMCTIHGWSVCAVPPLHRHNSMDLSAAVCAGDYPSHAKTSQQ